MTAARHTRSVLTIIIFTLELPVTVFVAMILVGCQGTSPVGIIATKTAPDTQRVDAGSGVTEKKHAPILTINATRDTTEMQGIARNCKTTRQQKNKRD